MLYDEISRLQEENRKLKEELKSVKFDEHFLENGNTTKKTNFVYRLFRLCNFHLGIKFLPISIAMFNYVVQR